MWLPPKSGRVAAEALLIAFGAFAAFWVIARACVQGMTGDEAESYELWAARTGPSHWWPAANNHVLNSLLMRIFTSVFPLCNFTVRAPAVIGAIIYIALAYWLCRSVSAEWKVRIPLFVCLVYNPFLFDYFVAGRGYGLATAFLMCAIAITAWCHRELMDGHPRPLVTATALSSICLALSFAANFSFALVDAVALLLVLLWGFRFAQTSVPAERNSLRARLLVAGIVPGLILTILIPAWTVLHWPQGQLWEGATSLTETITTVVQACLYQLNPHVGNPLVLAPFRKVRHILLPAACILALFQAVLVFVHRARLREIRTRWVAAFGAITAGVLGLSLLAHWLALQFLHLLLPRHRTAIFLVPLWTLAVGIMASIRLPSRVSRVFRGGLIVTLCLLSGYFLLCLRLTPFKEWDYQADLKKVYEVVAYYNHTRGVRDVEVAWWYHAAMNYYRLLSGHETLNEFSSSMSHPADKQLYVLNAAFEQDFIDAHRLTIVYKGETTDVVVAVRPELLAKPVVRCYPPEP